MKAKKFIRFVVAEMVDEAIGARIDEAIAHARREVGLTTLTVQFENKSISFPIDPWRAKGTVRVPGRWEVDE